MLYKILLSCVLGVLAVEAAPRFPVPTRLRYGPTVPIAKAAAEAALGYAASARVTNVAPVPGKLTFGARVSKSAPLALSASTPIRSAASYTAYPASVAASAVRAAIPTRVAPPRFAPPTVYSKAPLAVPVYAKAPLAAPIYRPAPLITAPAFAAPQFAPISTKVVAAEPRLYAPQPYSFGYQSIDEYGNRQSREEQSDANNFKKGSYSYTDAHGISRRVDYVADNAGFRATIATNEPGTAPSSPADALYTRPVHRKA